MRLGAVSMTEKSSDEGREFSRYLGIVVKRIQADTLTHNPFVSDTEIRGTFG